MIPAAILAAGLSTRMGGHAKALLPLANSRTFLQTLVATFRAAGVEEVLVIVGHQAAEIAAHLKRVDADTRCLFNRSYRDGQFSSVLTALDAVDRPDVEALLLTLVDVPLVSADTVRAVVERFHATGAPIVRPVRGDDHGHPVLIARPLFAALRASDPAAGAKPVVRRHASAAGDVLVDDPFAFRDIDTPDEHRRLLQAADD